MLLNLSSFPSSDWGELQKETALKEFESIKDIELPPQEVEINETNVEELVKECADICKKYFSNADRHNAVYIQADEIYTFYFVKTMLEKGYRCITPLFKMNGTSMQKEFVRFREYKLQYHY